MPITCCQGTGAGSLTPSAVCPTNLSSSLLLEKLRPITSTSIIVAGALTGPGNLSNNVTISTISRVDRLLPATKGQVQDNNAKFEEYRKETTSVIDALVSKVNSLTPVGCLFLARVQVCEALLSLQQTPQNFSKLPDPGTSVTHICQHA